MTLSKQPVNVLYICAVMFDLNGMDSVIIELNMGFVGIFRNEYIVGVKIGHNRINI